MLSLALHGPPLAAQVPTDPAPATPGNGASDFVANAIEFEPVTVTATPGPSPILTTPAAVGLLSGENKIRRERASLGATLDSLPGVASIGTGSQVGKPVIRGLSGNRIRILLDGIPQDHQQFGVRHPPNADPFLSERIEVVRGASSILYGSDALGGVVNLISPDFPRQPAGVTDPVSV